MDPNWDMYRTTFPDRYWKYGVFDDTLQAFLKGRTVTRCVDVGGGAFGTQVLEQYPFPTFLLDPNVTHCPSWMAGRVDWDSGQHFDLAVARGSINYLSDQQFKQLKHMPVVGGCIVANTFLTAPSEQWRERAVVNGAGEEGIERTRLHKGMVEHILLYGQQRIEHTFFYRSQDDFERLLPGCCFVQHAHNSYTLFWNKKDG